MISIIVWTDAILCGTMCLLNFYNLIRAIGRGGTFYAEYGNDHQSLNEVEKSYRNTTHVFHDWGLIGILLRFLTATLLGRGLILGVLTVAIVQYNNDIAYVIAATVGGGILK